MGKTHTVPIGLWVGGPLTGDYQRKFLDAASKDKMEPFPPLLATKDIKIPAGKADHGSIFSPVFMRISCLLGLCLVCF